MGTPSGKGKGGKGEGITIKKSWQRLNAEKLSQKAMAAREEAHVDHSRWLTACHNVTASLVNVESWQQGFQRDEQEVSRTFRVCEASVNRMSDAFKGMKKTGFEDIDTEAEAGLAEAFSWKPTASIQPDQDAEWEHIAEGQVFSPALRACDTGDGADVVRFVCISDTHNTQDSLEGAIPEGDVLLHAGDITTYGQPEEALTMT